MYYRGLGLYYHRLWDVMAEKIHDTFYILKIVLLKINELVKMGFYTIAFEVNECNFFCGVRIRLPFFKKHLN